MPGYIVTHRGVPVGRVDRLHLTSGDLAVGELTCAPGYDALRPLISSVSRSLWSVGFLSSGTEVESLRAPLETITRAAQLVLELRSEQGELVPTDFLNIVERPSVEMPPVVFARLRLAPSGRAAERERIAGVGGASC